MSHVHLIVQALKGPAEPSILLCFQFGLVRLLPSIYPWWQDRGEIAWGGRSL